MKKLVCFEHEINSDILKKPTKIKCEIVFKESRNGDLIADKIKTTIIGDAFNGHHFTLEKVDDMFEVVSKGKVLCQNGQFELSKDIAPHETYIIPKDEIKEKTVSDLLNSIGHINARILSAIWKLPLNYCEKYLEGKFVAKELKKHKNKSSGRHAVVNYSKI